MSPCYSIFSLAVVRTTGLLFLHEVHVHHLKIKFISDPSDFNLEFWHRWPSVHIVGLMYRCETIWKGKNAPKQRLKWFAFWFLYSYNSFLIFELSAESLSSKILFHYWVNNDLTNKPCFIKILHAKEEKIGCGWYEK